ncbi:hypothetical protein ACIG87_13680 [Micromonospora sp. NPDC051925]|uniref:hypothetical protein n=1 Tax=Micromonospora sp. NPDC051925 TaxID=3364288 RepID=UPI0037C97A82
MPSGPGGDAGASPNAPNRQQRTKRPEPNGPARVATGRAGPPQVRAERGGTSAPWLRQRRAVRPFDPGGVKSVPECRCAGGLVTG